MQQIPALARDGLKTAGDTETVLAARTSLTVSLALLVLIGYDPVTQLVAMNTLIQVKVPDGLQGRVFSVYLWALQGVAPLGSLLIDWLAQNWGCHLPRSPVG